MLASSVYHDFLVIIYLQVNKFTGYSNEDHIFLVMFIDFPFQLFLKLISILLALELEF